MAEVTQILCPICHKTNLPRARFCQHCGHDIVLNNDNPTSGDSRRYLITSVIKKGGQGAVYKALDTNGKVYALKEMLDKFSGPREHEERLEAIRRFDEEAELLMKLKHPRIPVVYSHFEDSNRHYLTMDFIEGEDLDDVLDRQGALPEAEVLELADQICDVLDYLHANELIYRDMKPSNIMLDRKNGGIKLVDFGIAKLFEAAKPGGTQIGTPGYAPPEQYQGLATPASDIYSLGATLHHMVTGRDPTDEVPFSFPPVRSINPKVSERTSTAIEKALQMSAEERWASVAELRAALRSGARTLSPRSEAAVSPRSGSTVVLPPPVAARQPASVQAARPGAVPAPMPATVVPVPQPSAPVVPRRRRRWIGGFMRLLLWLTLLGGGAYTYIYHPEVVQPIITTVEQYVREFTEPMVPLVSREYQTEVEVTLPATASDQEVLDQLRSAYEQKAKTELGASTVINSSVPPASVGGVEKLSGADGQATYRATMRGQVAAPQPQ